MYIDLFYVCNHVACQNQTVMVVSLAGDSKNKYFFLIVPAFNAVNRCILSFVASNRAKLYHLPPEICLLLSRNEPTVRGTRIKDHGIRFSRLAGSAILGGLLVFLKVMIMRALIMRRWIRGWILSISDWMKNMALEIDDLRQSINRENQNIKKIRPEAFWPFR